MFLTACRCEYTQNYIHCIGDIIFCYFSDAYHPDYICILYIQGVENWTDVMWLQIRSPVNRIMNLQAANMSRNFVNNQVIISLTNFNAQFFIHQQYVCYTIILDMFRTLTCPSSGGKIVFTQHLVSSFSVNGCTVHRLRTVCSQLCTVYRERRYQMLCEYNFSS